MKTIMWFGIVLAALSAAGEVIHTKLHQPATINCGVQSFSQELEWRHGDNMIFRVNGRTGFRRKGKGDIMKRVQLKQDKILEISSVEEKDAGEFTCIADDTHYKHTLLVVSVSISPSADLQLGDEATLNCQVKGLDPTPRVEWERPDGRTEESQIVQLKSVTSSEAGVWACKFSQDGNVYKETLNVNVKARQTPTPFPQSATNVIKPTCYNCTTNPHPHEKKPLGLSWWMWAAVGGGSLVVVLLTVCVIVLCKRNRRRRRKYLKLKKARELLEARQFCQCNRPAAAAPPPRGRRREKPSAVALMK